MGDQTGIEWTEATWNPVVGCTHVSAGCDHCYAARETSGRLSRNPTYAGLAVAGRFTGEVRLLPERLDQPLRWRRPRRVFVNSMSDLFHDSVPDEFIGQVFAIMGAAPQHTFQVLTKRPGRMASLLRHVREPLPNVWLGTSVENQKWAEVRIPKLLDTPAAVRFLSAEPLLGPLDLDLWLDPPDPDADCGACGQEWWYRLGGHPVLDEDNDDTGDWCSGPMTRHSGLDWIITGGESGPGHRQMAIAWVDSLYQQCRNARVALFVKQDSGARSGQQGRLPNWLWQAKEYPEVPA